MHWAAPHIVGTGCTPLLPEQDAVLDELLFDATSAARARTTWLLTTLASLTGQVLLRHNDTRSDRKESR
jgi:hypothetical protein